MSKGRPTTLYILYHGEDPLIVGTAHELADYMEVKIDVIYCICSNSKKIERPNGYNIYVVKG